MKLIGKKNNMSEITQDLLLSLFSYKDGGLYWNISKQKIQKGKRAGSSKGSKYHQIKIDGKKYYEHRLVYLYHHGVLPDMIDHINANPLDNRIENLRSVFPFQNSWNSKKRIDNTSGVKGISYDKSRNKWTARCSYRRNYKYLGRFDLKEDAVKALHEFRNQQHKEFARHE